MNDSEKPAFAFHGSGGIDLVMGWLRHITRRNALRSLRSLGLRHIFTSAIATVKTSHTPETL